MKFILRSFLFICLMYSGNAFAQAPVTGKVTSANGEPIVGVSVVEKGTGRGTITDTGGSYTLQVNEGTTLIFSFIGYVTQEIKHGGRALLDVTLEESAELLGEVQIVGSRNSNRTVTETPVAVDVIDLSQVATSSGQLDINQLLQVVAPSFNSNR